MIKIIVSLVFLVFTISANAANLPEFPFVVSEGEAKQEVKPDMASININVPAFDKDSSKAFDLANQVSKSVIDLLKKYEFSDKQLIAGDIQKTLKDNATQMARALDFKIHSVFSISHRVDYNGLYASLSAPENPQHRTLKFRRAKDDVAMFIPETIEISQYINVVFRLE